MLRMGKYSTWKGRLCWLVSVLVVQVQLRLEVICLPSTSCNETGFDELFWSWCNANIMTTVRSIAVRMNSAGR